MIFNDGFRDALTVGEEIYQCDIVGKQPVLTKLNPQEVRVIRSGYSNRVEDADAVVIEQYWAPGRVIDYYYDVLTPSDVKYINSLGGDTYNDSEYDFDDARDGFIRIDQVDSLPENPIDYLFNAPESNDKAPFDSNGNIKVLRAYWKSRRKIK